LAVGHPWLWICIESPAEAATEALQPADTGGRNTYTGNARPLAKPGFLMALNSDPWH